MRGVASCALVLWALGFVACPATAGPTLVLSSPVDLTTLTVGQQVPIQVSLQGLDYGNDFIFVLNSHVLFPGDLLIPVRDLTTTSGLTPGPILGLGVSPPAIPQSSKFDLLSSLTATSATGNFADFTSPVSVAINQNGLYYSFILQAASVGSGSIQFDSSNTAYASVTTKYNLASLPTGGPLAFAISAAAGTPEPSTLLTAVTGAVIGLGLWWRRHKRSVA